MFEGFEEIRRTLEQQRQFEKVLQSVDLSFINQALKEQRQIQALIGSVKPSFINQLLEQHKQTQAMLNALNTSLINQVQPITTVLRTSALVWNTSISTAIQKLSSENLFFSHPLLAEQLMEPYRYWDNFLQTTIKDLSQVDVGRISDALKGSLIIAQKQIVSSTSQLEAIIEEPEDEDEAYSEISLNVLELQRDELLASNAVLANANYRTLVTLSPTAGLAKQARRILAHVVKCNNKAKLQGKEEIFKPTTRLLESYNNLPWIGVRDEESFGNFVDCLYFMLYESAGKDHLRFLTEGYLREGDCTIIWAIKHLRNKYLRHDPDHGKLSDIRKSWQDLSAKLELLGVSHLPASINDYQYLQQRLLHEVEQFLKRLLSNMIEK
jgi:hypothetical protein